MKPAFTRTLERSGFALLLVLFTVLSMTLILGSVMLWLSSSAKQAGDNVSFTSSQAAAEAATEVAFAWMDRDFLINSLQAASAYDTLMPDQTNWPTQYAFDDGQGNTNQIYINIGPLSATDQPLGGQYANLLGEVQTVTVSATATPLSGSYRQPANVEQQFTFATIPAFQFAIFYNINLEIDPGSGMNIQGGVFSNGGIWTGGQNATYSSTVEAAGQVNVTGVDPFLPSYTTTNILLSEFTQHGQPVSSVDPLEIPIGASGSTGTNSSETNVIAIVQIAPASVAAPQPIAYAQTNGVYTYNRATLIVSNWSSGYHSATPVGNNFTVYVQESAAGSTSYTAPITGHFTQPTNDFYIVTNTSSTIGTIYTNNLYSLTNYGFTGFPTNSNPWSATSNVDITWTYGTNHFGVQYIGWSWLTNTSFYDFRESDTVQAVQVDVGALRTWITNSSITGGSNWNYALAYMQGKGFNSVYVYNAVPLTSTVLPAVRVVNGIRLPNSTNVINNTNNITSGLTVVTPQPMYVLGNYNVQIDGDVGTTHGVDYYPGTNDMSHTYPAALMADAITVLSTNWNDSWTSTEALSNRVPVTTCLNAACLEGIVQSSTNYPSIGGVDGYSGGVENFLRLLEDWASPVALEYNGSIMVMFPSQYATNWWQQTGNYYNAPKRIWAYDTNFNVPNLLPPLTPSFTAVIRSNYFNE